MYTEVFLSRIVFSDIDETNLIFLREKSGNREFPIVIGGVEALIMEREIYEEHGSRPLTHILLGKVIQALGGEVKDVIIYDIKEDTFYAAIRISTKENGNDKKWTEIDCRPSDAVAMAISQRPPLKILVNDCVWERLKALKQKE
ncbi:MAG: bifunctional nuclease family protein [Planctomycetia bacterium]|nr:bifunctional nuclease family protein [Planctomycetia bacterium]